MKIKSDQMIYCLAVFGILIINFLFMNKSLYVNPILGYGSIFIMVIVMFLLSLRKGKKTNKES